MAGGEQENLDFKALSHTLSKEERTEVIRRLDQFETDFKDMLASLDPLIQRRLRELAGPHFDIMLRSQEATLKYLSHGEAKIREAALQLLYQYWSISDAPKNTFEKMAASDPSDDVRDAAIGALGTCYARTKDRRIGHLLATIVRNDGLSDGIRLTAFMSLLRVHGMMDYTGNSPVVPLCLKDIDWQFVDQYYHANVSA